MAIHGLLPGVEVSVYVDGRALLEHNVSNDDSTHSDPNVRLHEQQWTKTAMIGTQPGKSYSLKIKVTRPFHMDCPNLSFRTYIGGKIVSKPIMRRREYSTSYWKTEIVGPAMRGNIFGPPVKMNDFKFPDVNDESDDLFYDERGQRGDSTNNEDIVMKVFRMSEGRRATSDEICAEKDLPLEETHHGKRSQTKSLTCRPSPTYKVDELDGINYPIVVFVFKCRSSAMLQDLGLIPRPQVTKQTRVNMFFRATKCGLNIFNGEKNSLKRAREEEEEESAPHLAKHQRTVEIIDLTDE